MFGSCASGKSQTIKEIISSLLVNEPDAHFIISDPRQVEYEDFRNGRNIYTDISHLDCSNLLRDLEILYATAVYKSLFPDIQFNRTVIIFDEYADVWAHCDNPELLDRLVHGLVSLSKQSNIYVILSTNAHLTQVLSDELIDSFDIKIGFKSDKMNNSIRCFNHNGASLLNGYGDMMVCLQGDFYFRTQCLYLSKFEIETIVNYSNMIGNRRLKK